MPSYTPLIVSLPIADRRTSFRFYQEALGLEPIGEPADDGVPEPLQFALNEGTRMMLVPTRGFGWLVADHDVARRGQSECLLNLSADSSGDVDALVERARAAGATVVQEPEDKPWGYGATFADPDGHLWMITTADW